MEELFFLHGHTPGLNLFIYLWKMNLNKIEFIKKKNRTEPNINIHKTFV